MMPIRPAITRLHSVPRATGTDARCAHPATEPQRRNLLHSRPADRARFQQKLREQRASRKPSVRNLQVAVHPGALHSAVSVRLPAVSRCWHSGPAWALGEHPGPTPTLGYSSPRMIRTSPTTASRPPITPMGSMIRGPPPTSPLLMTCLWNRYAITIDTLPTARRATPNISTTAMHPLSNSPQFFAKHAELSIPRPKNAPPRSSRTLYQSATRDQTSTPTDAPEKRLREDGGETPDPRNPDLSRPRGPEPSSHPHRGYLAILSRAAL